jgi:hypothetical protein
VRDWRDRGKIDTLRVVVVSDTKLSDTSALDGALPWDGFVMLEPMLESSAVLWRDGVRGDRESER